MKHEQRNIKHTYSKEIRSMFTKIICDIESLQQKIIASTQYQPKA
ncbi:MAG: hypothetical protein QNJ60_04750 [Xenococcaceae cyanobacterium MO_188.B19]|nr:hypothetical protein [Xenococcaceae cyanobacterium MO_188.B19]